MGAFSHDTGGPGNVNKTLLLCAHTHALERALDPFFSRPPSVCLSLFGGVSLTFFPMISPSRWLQFIRAFNIYIYAQYMYSRTYIRSFFSAALTLSHSLGLSLCPSPYLPSLVGQSSPSQFVCVYIYISSVPRGPESD